MCSSIFALKTYVLVCGCKYVLCEYQGVCLCMLNIMEKPKFICMYFYFQSIELQVLEKRPEGPFI